MYMKDWVNRLDAFLQFNEEEILHDKGKVTAAIAKAFAESEFEKFRVLQDRTCLCLQTPSSQQEHCVRSSTSDQQSRGLFHL